MALSSDDLLAIQQPYARDNHAIEFGDAPAWAARLQRDGGRDEPPRMDGGWRFTRREVTADA